MTRKDLVDGVSMYYDFLKIGLGTRSTLRGVATDEVFDEMYKGDSVIIKKLPGHLQFATMIFSKIALETEESSNIWCLLGTFKKKNENKIIHRFIDLETMKEKDISILEYGEFCRNNSVVLLSEIYPDVSNMSEAFLEYRNIYLVEIAKMVLNLNIDEIELNTFSNYYDDLIKKFKKDGKVTIKSFKGHNR